MIKYFILGLLSAIWLFANFYVVKTMTVKEMANDFILQQSVLGLIFANCFYILAWIFKGIQWVFNKISKT